MEYLRIKDDVGITPKVVAAAFRTYDLKYGRNIARLREAYEHRRGESGDLAQTYKNGLQKLTIERLQFPIARYITTILTNYMLGQPVTYGVTQDGTPDEETALDEIAKTYRRQSKARVDKELKRECSRVGFAYELCWLDTSADGAAVVKSAILPTEQTVVVFDYSVERDSVYAATYVKTGDNEYRVYVYTAAECVEYVTSSPTTGDSYTETDRYAHNLGRVPITMYKNNDDGRGDYEDVLPLIDALDGIMTDSRFDIKKSVDGLLVFINTKIAGADEDEKREIMTSMKRLGILELESETDIDKRPIDVRTISSPINYASVDVFVDRVWRAIFTLSGVPDPLRTEYYTALSGVALQMQLFLGLKPVAQDFETEFTYGLKRRLKMYNAVNVVRNVGGRLDVGDVDITYHYTAPKNDLETAQMVSLLNGKVSTATLIGELSFVDDPEGEIEKARGETASSTTSDLMTQLSLFGGETQTPQTVPNNSGGQAN